MPNPESPRHNIAAIDYGNGRIQLGRCDHNGAFVYLATLVCDLPALTPLIVSLVNGHRSEVVP